MSSVHEDDLQGRPFDAGLMRRALRSAAPHWRWVALTGLLAVGTVAIDLVLPTIVKRVIDGPVATGDGAALMRLTGLFLAVAAGVALFTFLEQIVATIAGQKIIRDLRLQIFTKLQELPVAFFSRQPTGKLVVRVTNDVESLNELFTSGLVMLVSDLLLILGLLGVMFFLSWKLTLITLAVSPLVLAGVIAFRYFATTFYRQLRAKVAAISGNLHESIAGMNVLQLFQKEEAAFRKFEGLNRDYRETVYKAIVMWSLFYPVVELIAALAAAILLRFGGAMILDGSLSFGTFVAFVYAAQKFFEPIRDLSEKYNILQAAMAAAERIYGLLETPVEPRPARAPGRLEGRLEFQNVGFSYDGATPVLKEVSFAVEPGKTVALVGLTGGGKTTIAHLLLRFFDPTSGVIRVDGEDARGFDPVALRRQMALVSQDPFVFKRSVMENLRAGTDRTPEALTEAAKAAQLHEALTALPKGYESELAEGGSNLSTGQRQLLSIARALARDPRILVLDEATSSVDTETEGLIQRALDRLLEGRTALVIAHRLSTVRRADRILVVHHGRIVEEGDHETLMTRDGIYAKLASLQLLETPA